MSSSLFIEPLNTVRNYLNGQAQIISTNQVEIGEQITQIDRRLSLIDKKIDDKMKIQAVYAKVIYLNFVIIIKF